jgi:peptidoglycan/xylan/chitin deacetylase (PgdA/CDA1 family)
MINRLLSFATLLLIAGCSSQSSTKEIKTPETKTANTKVDSSQVQPVTTVADAATIMARKQVPILCYHHIRDIQMVSKASMGYEVTVNEFKAQMKALSDSGYHTITPDQLYAYLAGGAPLPDKPVMLTYDDTDEEQFTVAKAEMDKYGFKGVYFIMTISIGRPHYMSKEQIKQLSDEGHVIASHTWRHDRVDKYLTTPHIDRDSKKMVNNDWDLQLVDTRKKLEDIIGKEIHYFAYPYGIWTKAGIPEIQKRGFKLAFQLSTARDSTQPLYTVRRMIVDPSWSAAGVLRVMKTTFR